MRSPVTTIYAREREDDKNLKRLPDYSISLYLRDQTPYHPDFKLISPDKGNYYFSGIHHEDNWLLKLLLGDTDTDGYFLCGDTLLISLKEKKRASDYFPAGRFIIIQETGKGYQPVT